MLIEKGDLKTSGNCSNATSFHPNNMETMSLNSCLKTDLLQHTPFIIMFPHMTNHLLQTPLSHSHPPLLLLLLTLSFTQLCKKFLTSSWALFLYNLLPPNFVMDPTELKRVFQMFDRNGDGIITKKELNDSLEKLGIFIADTDLSQMIEKIDVNGDGYVDIDEFGSLYQTIMDEKNEEEDIKEAFNVFDQNGDGFITVEELKSMLASLGLKQGRTIEDCRQMIRKVDVDGDGMVNYKEFMQMMKGGGFAALGSS